MKKNGFMEGAIIATIAIILTKIIGVLYVIPFYKIIGTQGGALYGYAYNIYNIFLIISSAGIPLAISKITSEYDAKKEEKKKYAMFEIAKRIIYIFSICSFLICFLFAKPIANLILGNLTNGNTIEDVTFVIRCVSFALLIVPILSISRGYLQGHNYITPSSNSQIIEQIVRIIIILLGSYILVNILNVPLVYAVGVSVFAAAIGAIVSYLYLYLKLKKSKIQKKISLKNISKDDKKEIISKLIGYSIPFIVINVANSLYNTTDMILIIRGLTNLGFPASDVEEISSIFTTWGSKLLGIVRAIATGLTISLIPSVVSAFVLKEKEKVNLYFNKALQILLFVVFPITIFMSIFSTEIWRIFYGESYYGPLIFKYTILVTVLDSAQILLCSSLQGLYKTKLIYITVLTGLLINLCLDLPLIYLFHNIGLHPFYGAITATVIGYMISLSVALKSLCKNDGFNYNQTIKLIPKLIGSIAVIIVINILYKNIIPSSTNFILNCIYLGVIGLINVITFYLLNKRIINNILKDKLRKKGINK